MEHTTARPRRTAVDTADRYRKVAAEHAELSKAAADPHLGLHYLRIAEDYLAQSQSELRALE